MKPLLVLMIKNIAIIDMFRNGSGLAADLPVLSALFYKVPQEEIDEALRKLASLKVALFKSYTGAWSVFEGSDFDIDAAIAQALAASAGIDYAKLSQLMGMHPVVAKRHYHGQRLHAMDGAVTAQRRANREDRPRLRATTGRIWSIHPCSPRQGNVCPRSPKKGPSLRAHGAMAGVSGHPVQPCPHF